MYGIHGKMGRTRNNIQIFPAAMFMHLVPHENFTQKAHKVCISPLKFKRIIKTLTK